MNASHVRKLNAGEAFDFQNASFHLMNSVLGQFERMDAFYKCYS